MKDSSIILNDIDPVVFYGVNNSHLQILKSLFPKVRIIARNNVITLLGNIEDVTFLERFINNLINFIKKYNNIEDKDIINLVKGNNSISSIDNDIIIYSISGRAIKPHSKNQELIVDAFEKNDMLFAVGPAGTGKTYISIALAVQALKNKQVKKIILSRPAVEAGEKLGFLPGDMKEKIDPYLQPLYDALEDMLPTSKLYDMMEKNIIQIAPLAFMRGRTLNDAIIILDEAQNTTKAQIKMFLTRLGWNSKMIITGDVTQIDLPNNQQSGLREAIKALANIPGIAIVNLSTTDIIRHKLVTRIVNAFSDIDKLKTD